MLNSPEKCFEESQLVGVGCGEYLLGGFDFLSLAEWRHKRGLVGHGRTNNTLATTMIFFKFQLSERYTCTPVHVLELHTHCWIQAPEHCGVHQHLGDAHVQR